MSAARKQHASSDLVDNSPQEMEIKVKKNEIVWRDSYWYDFKGKYYRNEAEFKFSFQNFRVIPKQKLLDLGAGSGRFTAQFAKRGAETFALDLSKRSLRHNKEHTGCQCVQADLCHLPFKRNSFDSAAALSCFQYLPTEETKNAGLREVWDVLKTNGQFLIAVHNYRIYDHLKKKKEGYFASTPPLYYYRYDTKELENRLSLFFTIKDIRAILLFHPIMRRCRLGDMKWLVKLSVALESLVVRVSLSFKLSDFLVVVCRKRSLLNRVLSDEN